MVLHMLNNSRLQSAFQLSSRINFYVPATNNINEEIDNTPYVDRIASLFSECFGGSTSTPALGYWKSPTAGLVKEKTTIVFAYCSDADLQQHIETIVNEAEAIKVELNQDNIALEINGIMYFV